MKGTDDLDVVDAATLKVWRATNLMGWGAAGVVVFLVAETLGLALARGSGRLAPLFAILGWVLGAVGAGWMIGRHVYRSPVKITFVAFLLPTLVILAVKYGADGGIKIGGVELGIATMFPLVIAGIASIVARRTWLGRPGALRAG